MARTASKKGKPAKKAAKSAARKPARKAKPKAPARRAAKRAAPKRQSHVAEARALVARPKPGAHHEEGWAEHDHHDPRHSGVGGLGAEGDKVQVENYGQFKNKAVGRLDKPVNWFRRAPKAKQ